MGEEYLQECALSVMNTFYLIMNTLRSDSQKEPIPDLSVQQFRILKAIEQNRGTSLSTVSESLGATTSSTSKTVDSLVEKGYICRKNDEEDRRRLILTLTESGQEVVDILSKELLSTLKRKISELSKSECAIVCLAMDILRTSITSE